MAAHNYIVVSGVPGQRPDDVFVCDSYTSARSEFDELMISCPKEGIVTLYESRMIAAGHGAWTPEESASLEKHVE